jgi:O-antigen ligase
MLNLSLKTKSQPDRYLGRFSASQLQTFFLYLLFFSLSFSIAGDDFAIIGIYFTTLYLFWKKEIIWEKTPLQIWFGVMIMGFILSGLLSTSPLLSLQYASRLWRLPLPFLLYFSLKDRPLSPYLKTLGVSALIVGIYAVVQFFTGLDIFRSETLQNQYVPHNGRWNAVGIFSHHLTFGGVFLFICTLNTPPIFCRQLKFSTRIFHFVLSVVSLLAVIFSLGRSSWLGLISAFSIFAFFLLNKKILSLLFLTIFILLSFFFLTDSDLKRNFFQETSLGKRMASISLSSNQDRLMMWQASLDIIQDNPILGLGARRGEEMVPYYQKIAKQYNHQFQHHPKVGVHNIYLQTWIDFGILGLIGYLGIWFSLLGSISKRLLSASMQESSNNFLLLGLLGGFVGSMVAGFFENNFRDGEVQSIILTCMGLALILIKKGKPDPTSNMMTNRTH